MNRLIYSTLLLVTGALSVCAQEPTLGYHQQLATYQDSSGNEHPIKTIADWQIRREQILSGMQAAMGPLPDRNHLPSLELEIVATEERPKHRRLTVRFTTEGTERWSAYLYLPKGQRPDERRPGIVALHPTNAVGKGVCDGQSEAPNRAYGRELADCGYVVIAPDYPSFGDAKDYDFEHDAYTSGTMKGIAVHQRAIDLLQSRSEVDPDRIAAIGHSLGGHNAIFLGVVDTRIKAVVTSCGWCPFHDYYAGKIAGWTSSRYMPLLKTTYELDPNRVPFDFYELVAAIAPRAFFSCSPEHDANFSVAGVRKAIPATAKIYELYGVPDHLRVVYPDAQHDFPPAARFESYQFLDQHLKWQPSSS